MQTGFGVAARSRAKVRRTIVAVEINQRVAQRKWLRHAHEGVINCAVAMGVIARHGVTRNASALHVRTVRAETLLIHVPDNATVHGLQAVTHVRQCSRHDRVDRIVKERALHFSLELHWLHRVAAREWQP